MSTKRLSYAAYKHRQEFGCEGDEEDLAPELASVIERKPVALSFGDGELDQAYLALSTELKEMVNEKVAEVIALQGIENVRPGGPRWLATQRQLMRGFLCEAEQRQRDSEYGEYLIFPTVGL